MRVHRQGAGHKAPDRLDLDIRDRDALTLRAEHLDDALRGQDTEPIEPVEAREAIPGEERLLNLDRAILPSASPGDEGKEHFNAPAFELGPDPFLVTRSCAERVPAK